MWRILKLWKWMAHCGLKRSRQWIIIFCSFFTDHGGITYFCFCWHKINLTYRVASLDAFSISSLLIKVSGYHFLVLKRKWSYLGMRSTWLIICLFLCLQKYEYIYIYIRFLSDRHRTVSKDIDRNIISFEIISGRV